MKNLAATQEVVINEAVMIRIQEALAPAAQIQAALALATMISLINSTYYPKHQSIRRLLEMVR
jgi:hypothetical protein